jgi:hypothetical protein
MSYLNFSFTIIKNDSIKPAFRRFYLSNSEKLQNVFFKLYLQ